ncbi:hypothetical protein QOZ95_003321 [Paenibacillus brasilensis]|uniref:Gnk2-homologous domain-containing protein n=2 Tax=Paenibacillus brasilensis TaxID=128574 RepID=A0ABU0L2V3_9BACL|nr:hypothetical protein [Paenibacillus brasilensis]
MKLEQMVNEAIPILASNWMGHYIEPDFFEGILNSTEAIPSGTYVCSYYTGLNHVNCMGCLEKLLMYCKKIGLL